MEIKKISCETLYLKWDKTRNIDEDNYFNFSYYKTRPVKTIYHDVYKFKNYRELILTNDEIINFKNKWLFLAEQNDITYRDFLRNFIKDGILGFSYDIVKEYSPWDHFRFHYARENWFDKGKLEFLAKPPFYYFDLKDGEEVQYNKKELEKIKIKNSQEADIKIIETMLMPSLNNILDKYGLVYNNSGIKFKDYKTYTTIVKKFFEDTVVKDLKENGFDVKLDSKIRSFKYNTYLIRKGDIKLKLNNNKELP